LTLKQRTFFSTISRKSLWVAFIVSLVAAGGYSYYAKGYLTNRATTRSSTTQTAVAQRGNLVLSASGKRTSIAKSEATFGFKTSGQVTDVNVKVSDQVEAGQVLAQLDDTLLQIKYKEAQQALQELYSAASISGVEKRIATAQDTEYYAHEWLKYLLSPEMVEAEENLAIAQQKLADAQAVAKTTPSTNADQAIKDADAAVTFLNGKLTKAQTYYQNEYLPEAFGVYESVGSRRHPKQVLATYIDPKKLVY
jgi:multidrug efflux pump subunit AcrA (membrane-fusion protein)